MLGKKVSMGKIAETTHWNAIATDVCIIIYLQRGEAFLCNQ